jgi:hypothetical protein
LSAGTITGSTAILVVEQITIGRIIDNFRVADARCCVIGNGSEVARTGQTQSRCTCQVGKDRFMQRDDIERLLEADDRIYTEVEGNAVVFVDITAAFTDEDVIVDAAVEKSAGLKSVIKA